MAVQGNFDKQSGEVFDYDLVLTTWLDGDTISSHSASADEGITLSSSSIVGTDTVKVWLEGGTAGVKYKITIVVNTAAGRTKEDEFFVKIKET